MASRFYTNAHLPGFLLPPGIQRLFYWMGRDIQTEKAVEKTKAPAKEIILAFGRPQNLLSDNALSFMAKIVQKITQTLHINYYLHSVRKPQSSRKVEKANHTFKKILAKLCKEIMLNSREWILRYMCHT